jgi:glycosyltransferase involved in cell wall biosynthesis
MVSIIVPVHNTYKYIKQCIDSVISQTYCDWELLLLNDGSTDGSEKICDDYSLKDNRIRCVHKSNSGVSDTRNHGINLSRGKYIIFLDSDDYWCDSRILEKMLYLAEKYNLDIVRGEYKAVNEDGCDLFSSKIRDVNYDEIYDSADFIKHIINGEFFLVLSLIKKESIGECRFNQQQIFLEDMRFYSQLMLRKQRCMYIPEIFYAYRKNTDSVSFRPSIKKLQDSFNMCPFFDELALYTTNTKLESYFRKYSVMMYYWTLDTLSLEPYYSDRKNIIKLLRLTDLWRNILEWCKCYEVSVPIAAKVSPHIGVILFRYKHKMGSILRALPLLGHIFNNNSH